MPRLSVWSPCVFPFSKNLSNPSLLSGIRIIFRTKFWIARIWLPLLDYISSTSFTVVKARNLAFIQRTKSIPNTSE